MSIRHDNNKKLTSLHKSTLRESHLDKKNISMDQSRSLLPRDHKSAAKTNNSNSLNHTTTKKSRQLEEYERRMKQEQHRQNMQQDIDTLYKHINQINTLKKTAMDNLPRLKEEKRSLFDQFMKAKLLNKKILTRRDITLNRIIMKNIIKEYIGGDVVEGLSGVKVDV